MSAGPKWGVDGRRPSREGVPGSWVVCSMIAEKDSRIPTSWIEAREKKTQTDQERA